jgi:hypothetical protein
LITVSGQDEARFWQRWWYADTSGSTKLLEKLAKTLGMFWWKWLSTSSKAPLCLPTEVLPNYTSVLMNEPFAYEGKLFGRTILD